MNKALFDRDFDREDEEARAAATRARSAVYTAEDMAEACELARQEAFEEGRAEGQREAAAAAAESDRMRRTEAMERITAGVEALLRDTDVHAAELEKQVLTFALAVFEKMAPELMENQGARRAETEVRAALGVALGTSAVRIFLSSENFEAMAERLEEGGRSLGHDGRIDVIPDPEMGQGDARVEWDNGFMQYSFDTICNRILKSLRAAAVLSNGQGADANKE